MVERVADVRTIVVANEIEAAHARESYVFPRMVRDRRRRYDDCTI
jgi:hypothetical protein